MENRYTYICKVYTNWVGVEEEFELSWMTKEMYDNKDWDDDNLCYEVIEVVGLEYEVDEEDGNAMLKTSLSYVGCENDIELDEPYYEAIDRDYLNEAIEAQGIYWEVEEIDNLKEIRKEKLENLKKIEE